MKTQFDSATGTHNIIGLSVEDFTTILVSLTIASSESLSERNRKAAIELRREFYTQEDNVEVI